MYRKQRLETLKHMSFEEAAYDLRYYGENRDMERLIIETIVRLPYEISEFACERCRFISVGKGINGITLPGRVSGHFLEKKSKNKWIILLDDNLIKSEKNAQSVIAHEIAHAWLEHDGLGEMPEDCEEQAHNLTRNWGFKGVGADEYYCNIGVKNIQETKPKKGGK